MTALTFDEFVGYLRSALLHLYDPDQLRRNPLAAFFGVAGEFDAASAFQRILTEAIERLQPGPEEPAQSRAWRIYDALIYRYVRGFDRDVVADQLGISGRQLRREQRAALEALAVQLWQAYGPGESAFREATAVAVADVTAHTAASRDDTTLATPAWLRDLPPEKPAELAQVLSAALALARPLAQQWNVRIEAPATEALPSVSVPQVALRHALLGLLGVVVPRIPGDRVILDARLAAERVTITVLAPLAGRTPFSEREQASLDVARQLAVVAGGTLTCTADGASFVACLTLPPLAQIPVLVVDDNADTLQLFERFAVGTRYCVTSTRDPRQVSRLLQSLVAPIVVLDVMMPEVDGWEVLAQLRGAPATAGAVVIICTVLPQEALALALGADAFLQKPVSREDFLAALDRQVEALLTD